MCYNCVLLKCLGEGEGVDLNLVFAQEPTWNESAPCAEGVKSILAEQDLILRSDGSVVILGRELSKESATRMHMHVHFAFSPGGAVERQGWEKYAGKLQYNLLRKLQEDNPRCNVWYDWVDEPAGGSHFVAEIRPGVCYRFAAACLVDKVKRTGTTVFAKFGMTDLVVKPGTTVEDVVKFCEVFA